MRHHAPYALTLRARNFDIETSDSNEVKCVRGVTLMIDHLRAVNVFSLKIRHHFGGPDAFT